MLETLAPLSRNEEKNLTYQSHVSSDDPRVFSIYEQYVDERGYEDHKATDHFQQWVFGYAVDYLESREIKTYETLDV